jgi:hypothetical protein
LDRFVDENGLSLVQYDGLIIRTKTNSPVLIADDAKKTEIYTIFNEKGITPFFYAAAMATKVKSFQDFVCSSRRY